MTKIIKRHVCYVFAFLCSTPLLLSACSEESNKLDAFEYGGTYKFTHKGKSWNSIRIYPESSDSLLFYLNLNRGPPSYNSGSFLGRIKLTGLSGSYRFDEATDNDFVDYDCNWEITFSDEQITFVDLGDNYCGFGGGVTAARVYTRDSAEIPEGYSTINGRKFLFKDFKDKPLPGKFFAR